MNASLLLANGCSLVPYCMDHDAQTVKWLNRPDLVATFGLSRRISVESHRHWVESAKNTVLWAIVDGDARHLGNVLLHLKDVNRSGYFQIYIGDMMARGRGLGKSAVDSVMLYGFVVAGLNKIWLHTIEGNQIAERLYANAGFVCEGKERDAILREGAFHYQLRWSILEDEWRARNTAPRA